MTCHRIIPEVGGGGEWGIGINLRLTVTFVIPVAKQACSPTCHRRRLHRLPSLESFVFCSCVKAATQSSPWSANEPFLVTEASQALPKPESLVNKLWRNPPCSLRPGWHQPAMHSRVDFARPCNATVPHNFSHDFHLFVESLWCF